MVNRYNLAFGEEPDDEEMEELVLLESKGLRRDPPPYTPVAQPPPDYTTAATCYWDALPWLSDEFFRLSACVVDCCYHVTSVFVRSSQ